MSYKDDELNELLKSLKEVSSSKIQIQGWTSAVQREVRGSANLVTTTRNKWALQLIAALFVGVVMGAFIFKSFFSNLEQNLFVARVSQNATFEHVHDNLD